MMHKGQTHIKRNCFSIDIISNQLQSGYYRILLSKYFGRLYVDIWHASINFHEFLRLFVYYYFLSTKKNQQNAHNYPNKMRRFIRENIRIFDIWRISDILYSNSISEQNIRIRIRYPKKSEYPKNPSEPVFTIFESGSGRIFSEPYYIPMGKAVDSDIWSKPDMSTFFNAWVKSLSNPKLGGHGSCGGTVRIIPT
jgi:hypothetical protein